MYMVGIDQWVCIGFGVVSASVLVWATFRMNAKYGEWGLMKLHALRSHPRYIINRREFLRLISPTSKKEKYEKRNETATLESKFPLLSVEHGCIVSKDADITVAYKVELPELFTLTKAEYEAVHSTWAKAVKVLPNYSIVHKQDFFIEESYRPDICKDDLSFLSRSFERHFNERPYFLQHTCYLFLTKTTKERSRTTSSFNALTRNFIIPKEMTDRETVTRFMESCEQFERIVNDSGLLRMTRLTDEEITERTPLRESSRNTSRLAGGHRLLAGPVTRCRGDEDRRQLPLPAHPFRPGGPALERGYRLPLRTVVHRPERLPSPSAAPIGILPHMQPCREPVPLHRRFGGEPAQVRADTRNMHSLSRYSRSNQINREWIEEYLNEAHSKG